MPIPLPAHHDDLQGTLAECWRMWSRGVADRRSPFHAPTVASIGLDGRPRARVAILRGCDPAGRVLRFHTDRRSSKFAELVADPRVALTAYDAGAKFQVRVEGRATLHTDDAAADAAWAGSRPFSRVCYGVDPAPGVEIAQGADFALPAEDDEIAAGRANFCAVVIAVETMESLFLAQAGHRRARFAFRDGSTESVWLTP
jgi:hypothetical protein